MKVVLGARALIVSIAAGLVLGSSQGFAQAPQAAQGAAPAQAPAKQGDYVIAPSKKEVIEQDSSAHHRIDKTFQITAILLGVGPSLSSSLGLQGSYFLNRNSLVTLEVTSGTLTSNANISVAGSQSGSSMDLKTKSIGAHFKHFTGNSFYYRLGADLRTADYSYTYNGTNSDFYKFKGSSIALNLQIGNQWQWDNFTLGCDWIGLSVPLTSRISDESLSATAPSYYSSWRTSDEELFVKNTHLNLLRFYLGASF
jgi:hypothetical protein